MHMFTTFCVLFQETEEGIAYVVPLSAANSQSVHQQRHLRRLPRGKHRKKISGRDNETEHFRNQVINRTADTSDEEDTQQQTTVPVGKPKAGANATVETDDGDASGESGPASHKPVKSALYKQIYYKAKSLHCVIAVEKVGIWAFPLVLYSLVKYVLDYDSIPRSKHILEALHLLEEEDRELNASLYKSKVIEILTTQSQVVGVILKAQPDHEVLTKDIVKARIDAIREKRQCRVCRKENATVLFMDCGHLVTCGSCSKEMTHCIDPCNLLIVQKVTTYKP